VKGFLVVCLCLVVLVLFASPSFASVGGKASNAPKVCAGGKCFTLVSKIATSERPIAKAVSAPFERLARRQPLRSLLDRLTPRRTR
jgi:hypothetical protein